jgi:uncharacterized protein YjiS (DUF1127 family)
MLNFIISKIKKYKEYQRIYKELNYLTDKELSDIGVRREDIQFIAAESVKNLG